MSTEIEIQKLQNKRQELENQNKNARTYISRGNKKIKELHDLIALEQMAIKYYIQKIGENTEKFHQLGTDLENITNTKRINRLQ